MTDKFDLVRASIADPLVKAVRKTEEAGLRPLRAYKMIFLPHRLASLPALGAFDRDRDLIAF
jgi:hypothetical protein